MITSNDTNLLVVPVGKVYAIVSSHFCNTSLTTESITVYVVPSGGSPSSTNMILKNLSIIKEDTYIPDFSRMVLSAGDKIVARGIMGNMVASTISYLEV